MNCAKTSLMDEAAAKTVPTFVLRIPDGWRKSCNFESEVEAIAVPAAHTVIRGTEIGIISGIKMNDIASENQTTVVASIDV